MKLRKIITLATAGTAAASLSLFGVGITAAYAVDQPVTFGIDLRDPWRSPRRRPPHFWWKPLPRTCRSRPSPMAAARSDRSAAWTVSANASNLVANVGLSDEATILAGQITIDETSGSFTTGTGTRVAEAAVVAGATPSALVSATGDTIDSVFTYTPTALLAAQILPFAGAYSGTVTQTVV